ncbi:MAG TPA: hypothetical protein VN605_08025, partial [Thermoanaerobaculia bacterium]|nr:hypothetical protein [Thermoanaerobaculia bacterium]
IRLASDQCSYGPLVQTTTSRGLDPNTPFMVVRTSNDIITDHNNIFTSAMVSYLVPFVSAAERKNVLGRCGGMTDPEPLTASVSAEK